MGLFHLQIFSEYCILAILPILLVTSIISAGGHYVFCNDPISNPSSKSSLFLTLFCYIVMLTAT